MNTQRFNELVKRRTEKIVETLASKGAEYSTSDNKLHNFDKAGRMSNQTREKALLGMLLKHIVSVDDIVDKLGEGKFPTQEVIDEKLGDIINYYILLEACLIDRIDNRGINRKNPLSVEECMEVTTTDSIEHIGELFFLCTPVLAVLLGDKGKYVYKMFAVNEGNCLLYILDQNQTVSRPRTEFYRKYRPLTEKEELYKKWESSLHSKTEL